MNITLTHSIALLLGVKNEDPTVKPQFKGPIILDPIVKQNLTTGQEL